MTRPVYLAMRNVADRALAALLLLICLPILGIIAIAIRLNMGSPVLFRQQRVGFAGRPFWITKFRTMVPDAESKGGGYIPPDLDLIPRLGGFLRTSSLDELPQLFNILTGDMAFVGPRPALPDQYVRYTARQRQRVDVPQGLTGLAQVRYRNNAPWSVRIEADLEYIANIGPVVDLRILAMTLWRVIHGVGVRTDQTATEVDDLGGRPEDESICDET